ncbi:MAG TPA: NAD(P)/FAD-dependent oxidoreductase [Candidatus Binatia bacterium]|nr:NAD(P)/FAD-dependent oxidoreductase [Candidatus Binatia bacterium]
MGEPCEVLVIGAGPAGLTAATYLARFRRRLTVVDDAHSRARYIPVSRNCPGFAHGVNGEELLDELREQAARHGVQVRITTVRAMRREGDLFVAEFDDGRLQAQRVVLATGLVDVLPELPGVEDAVKRGVVRLCAVCDAFETADRRVAVMGSAQALASHARFLCAFSHAPLAVVAPAAAMPAAQRDELRAIGVEPIEDVCGIRLEHDAIRLERAGGETLQADVLYPVLGARPRSQLAKALGASCDEDGYVWTDSHQRTAVPGLYAIGDVTHALNQIAVGVGQAAIAASAIHNDLPLRPLR